MKTKPCLTLEDCRKVTAAAEAEAKKNNWNVSICILDDGGHVLLLTRMDGASPVTAEIATQKGRSAAIARRSTKVGEDRIAAGRVALLKMPGLPVQVGCRSCTRASASAASASRACSRMKTSRYAAPAWR